MSSYSEKKFDSQHVRSYPSGLLALSCSDIELAKKKLLITIAAVAAALVLLNVIFGLVVAEDASDTQKRCAYSLYRLSVGLVEYANVKNTTLTPAALRELVTAGIVEESWLRCSEYASEFGYFGQLDLLGPRPPVILWCKSGHTVDVDGELLKATYIITGGYKLRKCTYGYLEKKLKEIDAIRELLAWDFAEKREILLELASSKESTSVQSFALWKLAQTRSRELESIFLEVLDDKREAVRHEAALGLAYMGNPAGGAVLMTMLRDSDYFKRTRAFRALNELTGNDFRFNPALDAESQPEASGRFDAWWAETVKKLRGADDTESDK